MLAAQNNFTLASSQIASSSVQTDCALIAHLTYVSEGDRSYDFFVGETSDYRWNEQIYGTWELG